MILVGLILLITAATASAYRFTGHGLQELLGWPLYLMTIFGFVFLVVGVAKGFKDE